MASHHDAPSPSAPRLDDPPLPPQYRYAAAPADAPHEGDDPAPLPPLREPAPVDRSLRNRLRLGALFALAVSLTLHSSLLVLFVGGTVPGLPDGQEAVPVEVITQEQYDLLVGEGSSKGGTPPKVDDSANGADPSLQTPSPPAPTKAEAPSEQREALNIVAAPVATEIMPSGVAGHVNNAASPTPRKAESKSQEKGSQKEATPMRRTEPKERPDAEREDVRNEAKPVQRNPGAEGGEMRRTASRGGVGDEMGPLPPSMRQALMQQLQKQIEVCYVTPAGTAQVTELPLVLIRFHRDGTLDGVPKSLRYERSAAAKNLVKAALKAVRQCAPYRMPPRFAPYYEDWKEIRAEFEFSGR